MTDRDADAALDQVGDERQRSWQLRSEREPADVAGLQPAVRLLDRGRAKPGGVMGAAVRRADERPLDVNAEDSALARGRRVAKVGESGLVDLRGRGDDGRHEARHAEHGQAPADRRDVRPRIAEVVAEGSVHLDVDQAGQDHGPRPAERARGRAIGRLDGGNGAVRDADRAEPAVIGRQQAAEQLDHGLSLLPQACGRPGRRSEIWCVRPAIGPIAGAAFDQYSAVTRV